MLSGRARRAKQGGVASRAQLDCQLARVEGHEARATPLTGASDQPTGNRSIAYCLEALFQQNDILISIFRATNK